MAVKRAVATAVGALLVWSVAGPSAFASQIVAIGASNTIGAGGGRNHGGVMPSEAWPAQLEQLLRARGLNVQVRNAGLAGDTTCNMLSRLDSELSSDTKVVIIQPGGNDARRGGCPNSAAANVAEMQRRLRARGIKSIVLTQLKGIAGAKNLEVDGQHFNREGHAAIAASLLPRAAAALR